MLALSPLPALEHAIFLTQVTSIFPYRPYLWLTGLTVSSEDWLVISLAGESRLHSHLASFSMIRVLVLALHPQNLGQSSKDNQSC